MSDLVRKSVELPDVGGTQSNGKIAKSRRKERAAAPSVDATVNIDDVDVSAESDMTDVAIAVADQSFKGATLALNRRYEQNLLAFGKHVNTVQAQTSRDLIRQITGELLEEED